MRLEQEQGLLIGPRLLVDLWVEMIMPSLSTLFPRSGKFIATLPHFLGYDCPILHALFHHDLAKKTVLLDKQKGTVLVQFLRMSEI